MQGNVDKGRLRRDKNSLVDGGRWTVDAGPQWADLRYKREDTQSSVEVRYKPSCCVRRMEQPDVGAAVDAGDLGGGAMQSNARAALKTKDSERGWPRHPLAGAGPQRGKARAARASKPQTRALVTFGGTTRSGVMQGDWRMRPIPAEATRKGPSTAEHCDDDV
ncbi:hypothetical protein CORC01_05108 [Colletotrichum orchidophilum]|uniref:Uncharacterized protein n=1 Tax=Colletotrichum orchidophilum TaxID=1209926 RepID=A0A1G4BDR4_9PEZI|nr:uncharacterized protein CORC01_05108 [Colletotrichum orchidophilum]OHE99530.1 hypothetical protein CORC01_05108 [Colletotrichum orchidophilum]